MKLPECVRGSKNQHTEPIGGRMSEVVNNMPEGFREAKPRKASKPKKHRNETGAVMIFPAEDFPDTPTDYAGRISIGKYQDVLLRILGCLDGPVDSGFLLRKVNKDYPLVAADKD